MNEPIITIVGNVAGEVDLRFSPSGVAVAKWTVASTPRDKDRATGEYVDGETLWVRCTAFKREAENAAESFAKGTRVIVSGRLRQESWEDKEGQKRTSLNLLVEEAGASVKWAKVEVKKNEPGGGGRPKPADDPWASAANSRDDDIPF